MDEQIRLQKYLADAGIASRRAAESLITCGRVKVNGQIIKELGTKINPRNDKVEFDNQPVSVSDVFVYYAVNKPIGYTSTNYDPHSKKNVVDLVPKTPRVFPVGRLDRDSEGLMILTNDGELSNQLTHPRFEHEKEYILTVHIPKGMSRDELCRKLSRMEKGVRIMDYKTRPATIKILSFSNISKFSIIIKEGKKRQLRNMASILGLEVVNLKRIRIGKLRLEDLVVGQYRKIKKEDILDE